MSKMKLFEKMDNRLANQGAHSTNINDLIRYNISRDNAHNIEQLIVQFVTDLRKVVGVD